MHLQCHKLLLRASGGSVNSPRPLPQNCLANDLFFPEDSRQDIKDAGEKNKKPAHPTQ